MTFESEFSSIAKKSAKIDFTRTNKSSHHAGPVTYVTGPVVLGYLEPDRFNYEANQGARWMPWLRKAKKDVASCDKLGRVANEL